MRNNYAEISRSAIFHNLDLIRSRLDPHTRILAVVKANAYGHGMEIIANTACSYGVEYLAVAIPEEGVRLRKAGIAVPVLLLGASDEDHMDLILEYGLTPTLFTLSYVRSLQSHASHKNVVCPVHLKVDTGMNRIGFKTKESFIQVLEALRECPNLRFEGLFTHFAVSELADKSFTMLQLSRFKEFIDIAHQYGYEPVLHAANSGAILQIPESRLDMVRAGIAMYGYHPSGKPDPLFELEPVLSWKTNIVHIKEVPAGEGISYGLKYVTSHASRIATLPVGYGDGYKRCMSGKASVLIRGKRAPQVGTICMDQMMVDITDIPEASVGDNVVLLGAQGTERITADDLAHWADTISYEILLSISDRVPRVMVE